MRKPPAAAFFLAALLTLGLAGCTATQGGADASTPYETTTPSHTPMTTEPSGDVDGEVPVDSQGVLAVVGNAPTTAAPGVEFPIVNVQLLAADGEPIPGRRITFTVTSGDASFPDGFFESDTDELGIATAYGLTAGATPGPVVVTAASEDQTLVVDLSITP